MIFISFGFLVSVGYGVTYYTGLGDHLGIECNPFVTARIREVFCPSILVRYVYWVFLFHGSDIISIMVISVRFTLRISLSFSLM